MKGWIKILKLILIFQKSKTKVTRALLQISNETSLVYATINFSPSKLFYCKKI